MKNAYFPLKQGNENYRNPVFASFPFFTLKLVVAIIIEGGDKVV